MTTERDNVLAVMSRINHLWLNAKLDDLAPMLHPDIVMVFAGFSGQVAGRDAFLEGFRDFCASAIVHDFHDEDHRCDVAGKTAIATFRYRMVYERAGERYRATGRDLWVFEQQSDTWIAVWRTMLEPEESLIRTAG